ncbi:hypothetical protein M0R19_06315 [Candidatus Pacearchaeota archaeon]|jgi:hypothetical protein|nr:hypothetical protein [Candidatus Pacearchaeota archaeon]
MKTYYLVVLVFGFCLFASVLGIVIENFLLFYSELALTMLTIAVIVYDYKRYKKVKK